MLAKLAYRASTALIFAVCRLEPKDVLAHAIVTESSLLGQALKPQKANQVVLNFNSVVSLSKIFLVRKGDKHEPVSMMHGSKPYRTLHSVHRRHREVEDSHQVAKKIAPMVTANNIDP